MNNTIEENPRADENFGSGAENSAASVQSENASFSERQEVYENESRAGFSGRGPKNYRASGDPIYEEINRRLIENDLIDASDIEVEVNDGRVVLSGYVDDFESKHLAEYLTRDVVGVLELENNLLIRNPTETTPGTFGSIEDLSANYSQKVYGNPAVAIREESEKAEALENSGESFSKKAE
jgi:hypothetical protein